MYFSVKDNQIELTKEGILALKQLNLTMQDLMSIDTNILRDMVENNNNEHTYGARIPTSQKDIDVMVKKNDSFQKTAKDIDYQTKKGRTFNELAKNINLDVNTNGRFPANLLCGFPISKEELRSEYPDATEEELDKMVTMIENPLDVGRVSKATPNARNNNQSKTSGIENGATAYGKFNDCITYGYDDVGDLSRYFSLDSWTKKHYPELYKVAEKTLELEKNSQKISPILFLAKPHRGEKDAGLEEELKKTENEQRDEGQAGFDNPFKNRPRMVYNNHPTGKPLALFNYLIHLFSTENDIILDPFCGSGTTCISAVLTKRKYIGIEINENYCKISRERVKFWQTQKEIEKNSKLF